ncbi:MAG: SUF system Fe-S cluster assembly protein [Parvularcula sp.]
MDEKVNFDPETGARDMISLDTDDDAPKPNGSERTLEEMKTDIIKALKTVYDPEIPVDIYELGLIYKVDYDEASSVNVVMTLTAPGCPVAGEMPEWVRTAVLRVDGVDHCEVEMVFDPPWTPERMSDEAKLELGWM